VKLNDVPCNDGDSCTQTDTCKDGVCVGTNPVTCQYGVCQYPGTCDPETGDCSEPEDIDDDDVYCNDGDACTRYDTCREGVCVGWNEVECPDAAAQCQVKGTCNRLTGQCSPIILLSDVPCDDGDACTLNDICQNGQCVGTNPVKCSVTNQCQKPGMCNPSTGICSNPIDLTGDPCNDGNACTLTDTCQYGVCYGYNEFKCPDAPQCQVAGTCNPSTGKCSDPVYQSDIPCDDGNACTQTDKCENGYCKGSNVKTCPPALQCQVAGTCNPSTGKCSDPQRLSYVPCDDGNACTRTDTCQDGKCCGGDNQCCKTAKYCGICVDNCASQATKVLNFFGLSGTSYDVSASAAGGAACTGSAVCCSPKNPPKCYFDRDQGICVVDNNIPINQMPKKRFEKGSVF
jgi:hypothetical protein